MGTNRIMATGAAAALAGVLLLAGCADTEPIGVDPPPTSSEPTSADASGTSESTAPDDSALSAFEEQLPLRGGFVSQQTETTGSVLIERRSDGSTWATLTGFSTGEATDLRLHLKEGALEQDDTGAWVDTAGYSFEIAPLDPVQPDQEIAIPGAHTMPAINTLTVVDYVGPDFPLLRIRRPDAVGLRRPAAPARSCSGSPSGW